MPSPKTPKNTIQPQRNSVFLVLLVLVSLTVNGYLLFNKKNKEHKPLVTMGGQSFLWKDISSKGKMVMANLDLNYYSTLKREADIWVENQLLPKEAQARSMTVADLLKTEVLDQTQVNPDDVFKRYVQSPQADKLPWPQVLKDIENEMKGSQAEEKKREYLEKLYPKYSVRYLLEKPRADTALVNAGGRFPVYERSTAGTPLRGSSGAPILLEVYGDFMCPFSVKFNSTVRELQSLYPDKILVSFRHFPLPFHQGAHLMAEASLCAEEQGKFWEYHDRMMMEAKKREKPELVQMASDLGLSSPKFVDCLDNGKNVKKVDEDIARGRAAGVLGTPGYLINGRIGSGAIPVDSMKPLIEWHLNPKGMYPGKPNPSANKPAPGAGHMGSQGIDPAKVYPIDEAWLKKGFSRGPATASVTLVEFFDYNCPFCRKGVEVSDALAAQYGDKLRIVSKHFPLPMHANASKASEALLCANEQSKFMELRKEILGDSWGKTSVDDLKVAAKKVGLDSAVFDTCLDSGKMKQVIEEDIKVSAGIGVQSTPTFTINGSPVIGAQPVEQFKKVIDEKLASKK